MSRFATLRVFYDLPEALVARSRLLDGGIPCFLSDGFIVHNSWTHIVALGGIRLVVHEPNLERAEALLEASAPAAEEGEPLDLCPDCDAEDLFRQPSWIAAGLAYLAVQLSLLIATQRRRCGACGHRWRLAG